MITVNLQEDAQTVADFIAENNYTFPVVLDTDGAIGNLYPTDSIPYTIIIAPDGRSRIRLWEQTQRSIWWMHTAP